LFFFNIFWIWKAFLQLFDDINKTSTRLPSTEESPDDLQINHQIRVEAHLVA